MSRPQKCGVRIKPSVKNTGVSYMSTRTRARHLTFQKWISCRIDGGFVCESRLKKNFTSIDAFRKWFRQAQVLDDQMFFMRQVRYHRKGLDLGMRWDSGTTTSCTEP